MSWIKKRLPKPSDAAKQMQNVSKSGEYIFPVYDPTTKQHIGQATRREAEARYGKSHVAVCAKNRTAPVIHIEIVQETPETNTAQNSPQRITAARYESNPNRQPRQEPFKESLQDPLFRLYEVRMVKGKNGSKKRRDYYLGEGTKEALLKGYGHKLTFSPNTQEAYIYVGQGPKKRDQQPTRPAPQPKTERTAPVPQAPSPTPFKPAPEPSLQVRRHTEVVSTLDECLKASGLAHETQVWVRAHYYDVDWIEKAQQEMAANPRRYEGYVEHASTMRLIMALACLYAHKDDVDLDALLPKAHLFVFDDDAWAAGALFDEPLTQLPYPVCLVEDVLVYERHGEIAVEPVADDGDPDEAVRLLSFVVNGCAHQESAPSSEPEYVYKTQHLAGNSTQAAGSPSSSHTHVGGGHTHEFANGTHKSPTMHHRRGHWRNQAYGPGQKLHKKIWIPDTIVTPSGKYHSIRDAARIHRVSIAR